MFKNRFIKNQIRAYREARPAVSLSGPLQSIGILVDTEAFNDVERFEKVANTFGLQQKDVKAIFYSEKAQPSISYRQNIFTPKDFSGMGKLKSPDVSEFLDRPYDVFVGYYTGSNIYLDLITARIKAAVKVGLSGADSGLFDLILNLKPDQYDEFEKELEKYVRAFTKQTDQK